MQKIAILLLACGPVGCATLVTGTTQDIRVRSDPPGATARIYPGTAVYEAPDEGAGFRLLKVTGIARDGAQEPIAVLTTPAEIELPRRTPYVVVFEHEGQSQPAAICRRHNPWVFGNAVFLIFGLAGLGLDYVSGAGFVLESAAGNAELTAQANLRAACRVSQ